MDVERMTPAERRAYFAALERRDPNTIPDRKDSLAGWNTWSRAPEKGMKVGTDQYPPDPYYVESKRRANTLNAENGFRHVAGPSRQDLIERGANINPDPRIAEKHIAASLPPRGDRRMVYSTFATLDRFMRERPFTQERGGGGRGFYYTPEQREWAEQALAQIQATALTPAPVKAQIKTTQEERLAYFLANHAGENIPITQLANVAYDQPLESTPTKSQADAVRKILTRMKAGTEWVPGLKVALSAKGKPGQSATYRISLPNK